MNSISYSRIDLEKLSKSELIELLLEKDEKQQDLSGKVDFNAAFSLFEALFDTVDEAFFISANDSFNIIYCNQAAVNMFEVGSKANLIGERGEKYLKDIYFKVNDLREVLRSGKDWKDKGHFITQGGQEFWGFSTIKLINVLGQEFVLIKLINATAHIQNQIKHNKLRQRLHAIIENTDDVIWSVDTNCNLIMYNPSFQEIVRRISGEEVELGEYIFSEKYTDFNIPYWKECYDRAFKGEKFRSESIVSEKEIFYFDNSLYPFFDKENKVTGVAVISRDVTDYKRIANNLKKNQRLLSEMEKLTKVGGWEYQLDSGELFWTDETYRIHELEIGTKVDLDFAIGLYPPDIQTMKRKAFDLLISKGQGYDLELPRMTAKGNKIWVRTVSNIEYVDGKPKRVFGAYQDITQSKIVENELRQAKSSLEEAMEEKDNFVSVVSHEIRTPLNAIIGMTDLLDQDASVEEKRENISAIKAASLSLLSIINDILDFSKIQSGKLKLEKVDFSISSILQQTLHLFQYQARKKKIMLDMVIADEVPKFLKGDPTRLLQVLNNLVGNAIKFTDVGKVTLDIQVKPPLIKDEIQLIITVKDTGIGIPTDKLKEVFEPFLQADVEINRKYGGTGLGLSIVKNLVEIQGGTIEVTSKENKGTSFKLILPFEKGAEVKKALEVSERKSLAPLNILYIEDVLTNQLLMKRICSRWNVKVSMASNGYEGVKKAKTKQFDLILVDLRMAGLDGFETARKIRKLENDYFKKVPIVAVTASSIQENSDLMEQAGINDAIAKPILQENLYALLSRYVHTENPESVDIADSKIVQEQKKIFDQLDIIFQNDALSYKKILLSIRREFLNYKDIMKASVMARDDKEVSDIRHKIAGTSFILEHKSFYAFLKTLDNLEKLSDKNLNVLVKRVEKGFTQLIKEFDKKIKSFEN